MSPVERIARALCDSDPDEVVRGSSPFQHMRRNMLSEIPTCRAWEKLIPKAEVVLRAIREPTDEMVAAGFDATPDVKSEGALHEVWSAMIDAALEEK